MKYNMLTYLSDAGANAHQKKLWRLRCECGAETTAVAAQVRSGRTKSCGCLKAFRRSQGNPKHGGRHHPLYATWCNMKARCDNPASSSYHNYGGRGITYCARWADFPSFLADVGEKPFAEASLDRINNDGNYEPGNVRWANRSTQRRNSRGRLVPVEIGGETRLLNEWCEVYGISVKAVHRRINCGMSVKEALTAPKAKRFQ
jgi:hypothetical protein